MSNIIFNAPIASSFRLCEAAEAQNDRGAWLSNADSPNGLRNGCESFVKRPRPNDTSGGGCATVEADHGLIRYVAAQEFACAG
jgi:hypothetical protein